MDQRMLAAICGIIVGRNGRRLPAYPDIRAAYTEGLFADYYRYNPYVSTKTCYKYANASTPYPHFLERHYGDPGGYRRNLADMMGIVDACPSITLLQHVQDELHQWVMSYLSDREAAIVCKNYVSRNASRREIAVYLADVMHHAICRKPSDRHEHESVID